MEKERTYSPPHPGKILKNRFMEPLNLSIGALAENLGVSRKSVSDLANEHTSVSPAMALKLAMTFDTTPEVWLNLQRNFDLAKARKKVDIVRIKTLVPAGHPLGDKPTAV